jgi:hypothetical protein
MQARKGIGSSRGGQAEEGKQRRQRRGGQAEEGKQRRASREGQAEKGKQRRQRREGEQGLKEALCERVRREGKKRTRRESKLRGSRACKERGQAAGAETEGHKLWMHWLDMICKKEWRGQGERQGEVKKRGQGERERAKKGKQGGQGERESRGGQAASEEGYMYKHIHHVIEHSDSILTSIPWHSDSMPKSARERKTGGLRNALWQMTIGRGRRWQVEEEGL